MEAVHLPVRCSEHEGVRDVSGLAGVETLDVMESLSRSEQITFVTVRHEQGAAFLANLYGWLSTYPGVCLSTLGPRCDEPHHRRRGREPGPGGRS